MNTEKLTPEQKALIEKYKAQGLDPAHIERIATRFESHNTAPQAVRGVAKEDTRPAAIRGTDGGESDGSKD